MKSLLLILALVATVACQKDESIPSLDPNSDISKQIQQKYCDAYKRGDSQAMRFAVNEAKSKNAAVPTADKCD